MQDEAWDCVALTDREPAARVKDPALRELDDRHVENIVHAVPGGASNVQRIYPLSPLQEGMLFHRLLARGSDAYVLSTLFELPHREAAARLRAALQAII